MKRCNINYSFTTEFGRFFRPSQRGAVGSVLYRHDRGTIKDVCMMKESEFRRFAFATDHVMNRIKEQMNIFGLRFGMTEEELDTYQDADFLKENPEEVETTAEEIAIEKTTTEKQPTIENNDEDKAEVLYHEVVKLLGNVNLYRDDICGLLEKLKSFNDETRVFQTLKDTYMNQPWWQKMFCSKYCRIKSAIIDTAFICHSASIVTSGLKKIKEELKEAIN